MAYLNKNAVVNCVWCGKAIEDWGNSRTNTKIHKVHTNGKCYAYLAYYEKNVRQLQAYMKTMSKEDFETVRNWFIKFGNIHSMHLGECGTKLVKIRNPIQVEILNSDLIVN